MAPNHPALRPRPVWAEPGRFAGLAPVQQVPTLVQLHLDPTESLAIRIRRLAAGFLVPDLMGFISQPIDTSKNCLLLHDVPSPWSQFLWQRVEDIADVGASRMSTGKLNKR